MHNGLFEAHENYGIVTWISAFAKYIQDHVPDSLRKNVKTQIKIKLFMQYFANLTRK